MKNAGNENASSTLAKETVLASLADKLLSRSIKMGGPLTCHSIETINDLTALNPVCYQQ